MREHDTKDLAVVERRRSRVIASPRARRAMRARGIDPALVRGSGPGGRIVEVDVLRAAESAAMPPVAGGGIAAAAFCLRRTADVTLLLQVKQQIHDEVVRLCGVALELGDLLLRAMALGLRDCPGANRVIQGDAVVALPSVDVGFAVRSERGVQSRVLRQADQLDLMGLVRRRAELAAADVAIVPATSLSDLSHTAVDEFAAPLLAPQSSVLAVGRPALRPAAFDNRLSLRQTLCLTLTADPRALDPPTAADFLGHIVNLLESPFLLFCERPRT